MLITETLPDGDGLDLVAEWPDIPFIIVGRDRSHAGRALEIGAQDYLHVSELKPDILTRAIQYAVERKLHERGRRELEHDDRLSSLGRLAASVAHDINNPASFVAANLTVLASHVRLWESLVESLHARRADPAIAELLASVELPEPREVTSLVGESRVGVERIVGIVRQLGVFARRPTEQEPFTPTSLNEVVEWACVLTRNQIQHHGRLELDLSSDRPLIMGRSGALAQVVTNLLVNAAFALATSEQDAHVVRVTTRAAGQDVELVVEDTGPGFAPAVLRRAFEPFYTTKGEDGSGLGLSIANEIVLAHDGRMDVGNRTDRSGARVVVRFPQTTEPAESDGPSYSSAETEDPGLFRILVVDDEPSIRRAYRRLLRPHEVVGEDAPAALERLEGGDLAFDLIVCDVMMPGVDGLGVYRELGRIAPELLDRFVFSTGGAFRDEVRAWLEKTPVPLLAKPTSRDEILAVVSERRRRAR